MQFRYVVTGLAVVMSPPVANVPPTITTTTPATIPVIRRRCRHSRFPPFSLAPCRHPVVLPAVSSRQHPLLRRGGADMASAAPPTTALDVTKESMVGNWRVSNGGANCDMFLTLTNLGSGSRGGTRGCSGELTAMGSGKCPARWSSSRTVPAIRSAASTRAPMRALTARRIAASR